MKSFAVLIAGLVFGGSAYAQFPQPQMPQQMPMGNGAVMPNGAVAPWVNQPMTPAQVTAPLAPAQMPGMYTMNPQQGVLGEQQALVQTPGTICNGYRYEPTALRDVNGQAVPANMIQGHGSFQRTY